MIPFAVWHEGMDEGTCTWVLAVSEGRLLLSAADGELYWKGVAECKFLKAQTLDNASMVMVVQPQPQGGQVLVPGNFPNREMRRNGF